MFALFCKHSTRSSLVYVPAVVFTLLFSSTTLSARGSFSNIAASPSRAKTDTRVIITFTASEAPRRGATVNVTVNGHATTYISKSGLNYIYRYRVRAGDPNGAARIYITATGFNSATDTTALTIDRVSPTLTYTATPGIVAANGQNVSISVTADEGLGGSPTVTVNSHGATYDNASANTYNYHYAVRADDPENQAAMDISAYDIAGNQTIAHVYPFTIDRVAPIVASVTDLGNYMALGTELTANWSASDATTGIAECAYAIGTTALGTDVRGWTSIGNVATYTAKDLALSGGNTYYFSIKAKDEAGNWSSPVSSDGIVVDTTPPTTPVVNASGTLGSDGSITLNATCNSSDQESGIAEYQYAIGTSPSDEGRYIVSWTSNNASSTISLSNHSLRKGGTYYFYVKAKNGLGVWSQIGVSNSIAVAPARPTITNARIPDSANSVLKAGFSCASLDIVEYSYALGITPTDTGTYLIPWTSNGNSTSLDRQNLTLPPTNTYFLYAKAKNSTNQWSNTASAQVQVKMDLLLGIGDFAKCTYIQTADSVIAEPADGNRVADGWVRHASSGSAGFYSTDIVGDSPHCQELELHDSTGKNIGADVEIWSEIEVDNSSTDPNMPHPGDAISFTIDRVETAGWPTTADVEIEQYVRHSEIADYLGRTTEHSSEHPTSVTVEIPSGQSTFSYLRVGFRLHYWGVLGNGVCPKALLSGAHAYIRRGNSSEYATEYVPVLKERNIKTNAIGWNGIRPTASGFDELSIGGSPSFTRYLPALRKLNPDMKIYLYQTFGSAVYQAFSSKDPRTQDPSDDAANRLAVDRLLAASPFLMQDIVDLYSGWLEPQSMADKDPTSGPDECTYNNWIADYLNASFYYKFVVDFADPAFVDAAAAKVLWKAQKFGVDGIWMDDTGVLTVSNDPSKSDGTDRLEPSCQQFLHAIIPQFRNADLITIVGSGIGNLSGQKANGEFPECRFNPSWVPDELHPAPAYAANTPSNTSDVFFQEFSFIMNDFQTSCSYWLKCLEDADIAANWNSVAPKRFHYSVQQSNTTAHHADGADGWIQFTLASYLLCQNDCTSFGINFDAAGNYLSPQNIDYSIIKRLGVPDGADEAIDGCEYFRCRNYKPTSDDETGGIVVVNGHKSLYDSDAELLQQTYTYTPTATLIEVSVAPDPTGPKPVPVIHNPGESITFAPGTARIFLYKYPNH